LLKKELKEGEAIVWYIFHSGWAIKTKTHFLIFDYWQSSNVEAQKLSLDNGFINPNEIKDFNLGVFVSHKIREESTINLMITF
jgi:L-ascorbate metabolism protein UlaG (beta-lactamase superfamily)